ncbi:glycerol-3-phosphate acyltransferase 3-like [Uloborus diversus]|uniref:glycerol-3-phosphate acyltransferase 3-like n=1 Tax=Uloborus diversus TaxID=327109 RepID=UPI0024092AB9|nr:glycerol-3-phosphate acyltransferase 3-like [Uloborus diversus]
MSDILSYLFLAFWTIIIVLLSLASFNATLGVRRKYVDLLLKVFEFGRIKIEKADKQQRLIQEKNEVSDIYHSVINKEVHMGPLPVHQDVMKLNENSLGVPGMPRNRSFNTLQREFSLWDAADFIKSGVEAIIEDEVTKRFSAEELPSWNLLTRTNKNYGFVSFRLSILWGLGFILRYWLLLPARIFITFIGVGWLVISTSIIGCIPESRFKRWMYWNVSLVCFRILARSFSAIVTYHNKENRATGGGICVANHTSPIDVVILACDNCYALVGQKQGGFLGILQRALARATSHVWFDRFEMKDRAQVTKRLREHVEDSSKLPILIFPEGTCINNTSVMMFKKGSFEVGGIIHPAAIKYDPRFGDPFWNSTKQGYVHYLLMMMTSWAIVCDVWYLPPMQLQKGESSIDFAKRVKAVISRQGGLVDLEWDGQLKRLQVRKEWKEFQQQEYSRKILRQ